MSTLTRTPCEFCEKDTLHKRFICTVCGTVFERPIDRRDKACAKKSFKQKINEEVTKAFEKRRHERKNIVIKPTYMKPENLAKSPVWGGKGKRNP